jgi:hypothetical protein
MLNHWWFEFQFIIDVVDASNVPEGSPVQDMPVKVAVGIALASYSTMLQVATEPLHRECPITPNWSPALDAVCNVEKAMDWKGANWEAFEIILIINSASIRIFLELIRGTFYLL